MLDQAAGREPVNWLSARSMSVVDCQLAPKTSGRVPVSLLFLSCIYGGVGVGWWSGV